MNGPAWDSPCPKISQNLQVSSASDKRGLSEAQTGHLVPFWLHGTFCDPARYPKSRISYNVAGGRSSQKLRVNFFAGVHTPVSPLGWDFSSMSCSASAYVRIAIMAPSAQTISMQASVCIVPVARHGHDGCDAAFMFSLAALNYFGGISQSSMAN